MKLPVMHGVITLLSVFFQTVIFHRPKLTYGNEISDNAKYNLIENNQAVQDRFDLPQLRVPSRSLENDDTCASACDADSISSFLESFQVEGLMVQEAEDEDTSRGFFSRITGLFDDNQGVFGRLMNTLFKVFNRSKEDDPTYMISTESVLPLLSTYSTKFKSLATMIREQSASDAALSTTPEAIHMIYNISALNMEAVVAKIDPILEDMQQYETIDIRILSCNLMQILTVLRDVTVPNIESITKLIYNTSNKAEMTHAFKDYTSPSSTENTDVSASLTTASSSKEGICPDTSNKATYDVGDIILVLLTFLLEMEPDFGPIVSITLLIVMLPISIVLSITAVIYLIYAVLAVLLFQKDTIKCYVTYDDDVPCNIISFALTIMILFFAPLFVVGGIMMNIRDLLDPFLPDAPSTPAPSYSGPPMAPNTPVKAPSTLSVSGPVDPPASVQDAAKQRSELTYRLAAVLESPIDTIINAVRNANQFSHTSEEDEEVINCEMAALKCRNDALMDILPF